MNSRHSHRSVIATVGAQWFSMIAAVAMAVHYYVRAAQKDERNGFRYTAAMKWRLAARLNSQVLNPGGTEPAGIRAGSNRRASSRSQIRTMAIHFREQTRTRINAGLQRATIRRQRRTEDWQKRVRGRNFQAAS